MGPTYIANPYYWGNTQPVPASMTAYQPMTPRIQNESNFVWVPGEEAAKAYPVAAGNKVILMDSENPAVYIKATDIQGRPLPMEIYDLVKRETASAEEPKTTQYLTMDDLTRILDERDKKFVIRKERNNAKPAV